MINSARWHGECEACSARFRAGHDQIRDLDPTSGMALTPCPDCAVPTVVFPVTYPDDDKRRDAVGMLSARSPGGIRDGHQV